MKKERETVQDKRYKYRLHDLMQDMSVRDLAITKKWLPKQLGISPRTFEDWKNIRIESKREIPLEKGYKLALFFQIEVHELFTERPKKIDLASLSRYVNSNNLDDILKS